MDGGDMATIGKFDFDEDEGGLTLVAIAERLSASCMRPEEIDWAVEALKTDLDAVARKMKRRLELRKNEDFI